MALAAVPWLEQIKTGQWSGDLHYHREAAEAGWTGKLAIRDAQIAVPGLAEPVEFASARAQIDGARVVLDQIDAQAGKVAFTGEYRYEPAFARPHRVRLRVNELDAADLEAVLMPTLRRDRSLIARALGRNSVPDWLKERAGRRHDPDRRSPDRRTPPRQRARTTAVGRRADRSRRAPGEARSCVDHAAS